MKTVISLIGAGLVMLLAGCASTPVSLATVGPNPAGPYTVNSQGGLQVYSRLASQSDGQNQDDTNPVWYQHSAYAVYDVNGRLVKYVQNSIGHYDEAPALVTLPAGRYLVKAQAKGGVLVSVPVTIERGHVTNVHLDGQWSADADGQVVKMPDGRPVGWAFRN